MPKTIQIAAIQMDARPAPTLERLARAESLVAQAAHSGAQLVVLPEVFNTGYEYSDQNFERAETPHGLTASWMLKTAAQQHVHLAGTFLCVDQNDIYNRLLLVAPDGRQWRYDKNYPWVWERIYFRQGRGVTIAQTDLGKIGFLICWDVAHTDLWQQYAGQLDLMLVSSCPPRIFDLSLLLPGGKRILGKDMGALIQYMKRTSDETFGAYLRRQASFSGIPLVHATSTGTFTSAIPNPKLSLSILALVYPPLWKHTSESEPPRIESGYFDESFIADANGLVLESVRPGLEGFALSSVSLPDALPQPVGKRPSFGIPKPSYWFDSFGNWILAFSYRKKLRKSAGHLAAGAR